MELERWLEAGLWRGSAEGFCGRQEYEVAGDQRQVGGPRGRECTDRLRRWRVACQVGGEVSRWLEARRHNCWRVGVPGSRLRRSSLEGAAMGRIGGGNEVWRRPREGKVADAKRRARGGR